MRRIADSLSRRGLALGLALGLSMILGACPKVEGPGACSKDDDCEGLPCVEGLCQGCRGDADCVGKGPQGEDLPCVELRCDASVLEAPACAPGLVRLEGKEDASECSPCSEDNQCPSEICTLASERCVAEPCRSDAECPEAQICDGGLCVFHQDQVEDREICALSIHFAYDSARLTPGAQLRLRRALPCLQDALAAGETLVLTGHADGVGDSDHSARLGEQRGQVVREFLTQQGLAPERLRALAGAAGSAKDEAARASDRRVDLTLE